MGDMFEDTFENMETSLYEVQEPTGIHAYLFGETTEIVRLPVYPEGKYFFNHNEDLLYIEGSDEKWRIHAGKDSSFFIKDKSFRKLSLKDKTMTLVKTGDKFQFFYCEYANRDSLKYHNYFVQGTEKIRVGKNSDNDIVYHNSIISDYSFALQKKGMNWELCDCKDDLFIYINGRRMNKKLLEPGDIILFLGLRIIVGYQYFAISDGNMRTSVNHSCLYLVDSPEKLVTGRESSEEKRQETFFNRSPRRRMPMEPQEIRFEAPPMSLNGDKIPLLLRMGSSMVTSGKSLLMGNFTSMISSVVFPILNSKYTEKEKKEYEERRQQKYSKYLQEKEKEFLLEKVNEEQVLKYNYPGVNNVLDFADSKMRLWERRNTDDDFMNIRIGYGDMPILAEYNYQKERFMLDEDELEKKMYELIQRPIALEDVPIMNSFLEHPVCGVSGPKKKRIEFVQRLIAQIVMTHSYDEVKLLILAEEEDLDELGSYVRYLPHVWDDQRTLRFLATNTTDGFQLSEYLKNELSEDMKRGRELKKLLKDRPYYMVLAFDKKIYDSMEILKEVIKHDQNLGVGILTIFDNIPKDCSKIFALGSGEEHSVIHINELDKKDVHFHIDPCAGNVEEDAMNKISNMYLKLITSTYTLPKMITFMEMFNVGKIEHLNPLQRWKTSNPVKTLSTPIGVATDGSLFELDLHQKFQGPHGLIAGMTGSGKSEFIITYILSLAINYHPYEVSFLLIDYKGGGLAGAFEDKQRGIRLPHLVGTITNLDGAMIQRSLMSIESELTRRQKIFNEVKSITGESSIDIYSYQSLYRNKIVEEPMPHLFIIADEFAEMKQQQPEFMEKLISTARIGRSLGVHLILATQKPSGVVNDQIRSNTKFRVCLKVQDKSDSMDMLKRPEAAELKDTGRFYLQVGYDEFFAMGQSAWAGALYQPQDTVVRQKDESVQFIDELGQTILSTRKQVKAANTGKSQLTEIVTYLSEIAKREQIVPRQLWVEPLPKKMDVKEFAMEETAGDIILPLGLLDDPAHQEQMTWKFNFTACRNVWMAGGLGSGKTTMIHTMLQSLMKQYKEYQVQYYVLDPVGRGFSMHRKSPYCGAVIDEESMDKIGLFSDLVKEIIAERKEILAKCELTTYEEACTSPNAPKMPLIVIFIDNLFGLKVTKAGEDYYYNLADYLKAGWNYGIRYIVTTDHLNEATMRIKQELGGRIAFQLKDKYEYEEVLGCRCQCIPEEIAGRGVLNVDGVSLNFQAAMYEPFSDNDTRYDFYRRTISETAGNTGETWAKRLPYIDPEEKYQTFCDQYPQERIPLGYVLKTAKPIALPFRQFSMLPIYFGNQLGVSEVFDNLLYASEKNRMMRYVIKRSAQSVVQLQDDDKTQVIECTEESLQQFCDMFVAEMQDRRSIYMDYCKENHLHPGALRSALEAHTYLAEETEPVLLLIERFTDFLKALGDAGEIVMESIFKLAKRCNVYIIAGFLPGDAIQLEGNSVYEQLVKEQVVLLFGGRYDKQGLITPLPPEIYNVKKEIQYNQFVMKYNGSLYSLQMPCGKLKSKYIHEDDKPII